MKSQPVRCRVQNTGNQYAHRNGHQREEKVKAMKSEIKKNVQGTNSEEKETKSEEKGLKSKIWNRRKK